MTLEFSRQFFENFSNLKFHENLSYGNRIIPCGKTDGQRDKHDKANSRFKQFF